MSTKPCLRVFLQFVFFAFSMYLAGCATKTGFKQGARTATLMNDAQRELRAVQTQNETTTSAMNALGKQEGTELPQQFEGFRKSVDLLESRFVAARKRVNQVTMEGDKFFHSWEKEIALITNPELQQRSEARKNSIFANFNRIDETMQGAEDAFAVSMSDLRDVERFLSVDLTPEGISQVADTIQKANTDASTLHIQIDAVIEQLSRVSAELPSK